MEGNCKAMTTVKGNHPIAEIIAKKLFGISSVPRIDQMRMVDRAAMSAVEFYESSLSTQRRELESEGDRLAEALKKNGRHIETCLAWCGEQRGMRWSKLDESRCNCGLKESLSQWEAFKRGR